MSGDPERSILSAAAVATPNGFTSSRSRLTAPFLPSDLPVTVEEADMSGDTSCIYTRYLWDDQGI